MFPLIVNMGSQMLFVSHYTIMATVGMLLKYPVSMCLYVMSVLQYTSRTVLQVIIALLSRWGVYVCLCKGSFGLHQE